MNAFGFGVAIVGVLVLLVSGLGLVRLPDALARQHAATKSITLALALILAGAALYEGSPGWWWRVGVILALVAVTMPVASHMLARAAACETIGTAALDRVPLVRDFPGKGAVETTVPPRH